MDATAHSHKLFHDYWFNLVLIERSSRLRADLGLTT